LSKKEGNLNILQTTLSFPNLKDSSKDKAPMFQEIVSLIKQNKDSLPKEVKILEKSTSIILDSEEYMIVIPQKIIGVKIIANKPDQNIQIINKISNFVISFINVVLKEKAYGASLYCAIFYNPKKEVDLPSKIIGSSQLAKANELTKEALIPVAIGFTIKKDNQEFAISSFYSSSRPMQNNVSTKLDLTDAIPFDIIQKQYEKLIYGAQLLENLAEGGL
jgi:hypothetical protein